MPPRGLLSFNGLFVDVVQCEFTSVSQPQFSRNLFPVVLNHSKQVTIVRPKFFFQRLFLRFVPGSVSGRNLLGIMGRISNPIRAVR